MSLFGNIQRQTSESTVHWKIENFSSIDASVGVPIISPVFDTVHSRIRKIKWHLQFYPGGYDEEHKDYVGLFLHNLGGLDVTVSYALSILNDKLEKVRTFEIKKRVYESNMSWGSVRLCSKTMINDESQKILNNDTLLISCHIKDTSPADELERYCEDEIENQKNSDKIHYRNLFESGEMSDVTFEIGSEKLHLHKIIVTSISPVFLAMFQHQMKEMEENVVKITDVKYEVMKELFRYIYLREIYKMENIVHDLFVAADKYSIRGLKVICEKFIVKNINEDNALQYLDFAMKYNSNYLKPRIIELIMSRLSKFVNMPEYEKMDESCKDELMRAVAKKFKYE